MVAVHRAREFVVYKIKVILEGLCPESVVFLFFNNDRSWTTTFQDDDNG